MFTDFGVIQPGLEPPTQQSQGGLFTHLPLGCFSSAGSLSVFIPFCHKLPLCIRQTSNVSAMFAAMLLMPTTASAASHASSTALSPCFSEQPSGQLGYRGPFPVGWRLLLRRCRFTHLIQWSDSMRPLLPCYRPGMKLSQLVWLQLLYLLQRRDVFHPVDAFLHLKQDLYFSPLTSVKQPRIFHYIIKL